MLTTPIFIFNVHVWYNTNLFFEALPSDIYFLITTVAKTVHSCFILVFLCLLHQSFSFSYSICSIVASELGLGGCLFHND